MVCGAVLELVKVLETTPYVLADPRVGAVAANAASLCAKERSAANTKLASKPGLFRLSLESTLATRGTTCRDRAVEVV